MIMQLEFTLPDVMADAMDYIETEDFIGSGHFMIKKDALPEETVKTLQSFKRLMDTERNEYINQKRAEGIIAPAYGKKFEAKDLLEYTYCGNEEKGVSDGETAFNPRYYWYITEFLGFDIHYQSDVRGRADIEDGRGLFAIVKNGSVVGSIMCLNPKVAFR